ncbi:SIR2 family protein [Flavilitoribacter nigricans]|uniref:Effector-associated domain-containing protein n=1 Tax=Flavilitoribacter nigricans (strain ATCC 23147 / DSM 23189 / NBRC 102662 / NCIMB 1420 / SS-2) TaxID=1122177 RepID=A0A2D0NCJ7_FLAN2|nr:SIR2 family protein [Flavilitoribacter nigricans]PHN06207.1 hypothetical protein CRP01_11535 [Flavilitoribacter nigricans DSM 23189 = NBRC 102662]
MSQPAVEWDFILNTLIDGKCILLIGPHVARLSPEQPFLDGLYESLDIANNPHIASFYEKEDFFLFGSPQAKTRVYYQIKDYYKKNAPPPALYEKLARLPFKMWINATPDRFLNDALDDLEIPYEFEYFDKSKARTDIPEPSTARPVVYNLTGVLEEEESLILTHSDLYQFLEAVLARQQIPGRLMNACLSAHSVIFLGFNFDKWHVQLMLRLLRMHDEAGRHVRYATDQKFNADTLSVCKDQFQIEFINEDIEGFVGELYRRCEEEGALREPGEKQESPANQIRMLIAEDELEEALDRAREYFEGRDEDLMMETLGIISRFNRLKKRMRQGVLDERDADVQMAKVRQAILELTNEM